jgi:protein-disulfide isomerase
MVNPPAKKRRPVGKGGGGGRDQKKTFYIILTLLAIVGITTLSYLSSRSSQNITQIDASIAAVPNQGHVIGSDSAPIEVVEFADFECPACGQFANVTEPDVRTRLVNTGLMRFRFIDYPLEMHRNTWPAHLAAWCAAEQGKFWEMHDLIFQNQDRWSGEATTRPAGVLTPLARQLGINMQQYESCVESRKYQGQIQANYNEAGRRGVGSTPTFFIGTRQVRGVIPYDEFKRYVDEAVAAARGTKTAPPTKR